MNTSIVIAVADIHVGERQRGVVLEHVKALADSIAEVGLMHPITVFQTGDGDVKAYELVAGLHRLEAIKQLGLDSIAAIRTTASEVDRGLAECDENLARAELDAPMRAKFTARRKGLYLSKYPETRKGVAGAEAKHGRASDSLSFAADTASKTGKDERSIQRDARRGEKIEPDLLDSLAGDSRATGKVLDQLARLSPAKQRQAVSRIKDDKPVIPLKRKADDDPDMGVVAERIARQYTVGQIKMLIGHLEAGCAKRAGEEITLPAAASIPCLSDRLPPPPAA